MHGVLLRVEYADISLLGGREENQDRVSAAVAEHAALLVVVDGMGGHADGARAAEVTQQVIIDAFWHTPQPLFDPLGFLHLALGRAHEEVVKLGAHLPLEQRPRATCAVCLVQQHASWWAHVGRQPHLSRAPRPAASRARRDHSHVELLLREGLISAEQAQNHPMRNFVECCLGGDPILPEMTLARRQPLEPEDVLLVCTDGLWGALKDEEIVAELGTSGRAAREAHCKLGERAVQARRQPAATTPRRPPALAGRLGAHGQTLAGARRMSCGRCSFTRRFTPSTPKARCWSSSATRSVLCTASVEDSVPPFLRGKGQGWVTAEYGMLPRATHTRARARGRARQAKRPHAGDPAAHRPLAARRRGPQGARRAHHHPRLRRAAGRRRHAHRLHHRRLRRARRGLRAAACGAALIAASPLHGQVAAVSVGICDGVPVLDLDYAEDSQAETDMNVVMNNGGGFVEVQGTAEGHAFRRHELDALLNLAAEGIGTLFALQAQALKRP